MGYTKEQISWIFAYADSQGKVRKDYRPEVKVDINLDGNNGTLTGFSNKAWDYGCSGLSFHYSYGTDHAPGSVCGHNICMHINYEGRFYDWGYFYDSEENQQKLRDLYAKCCSEVFGVSINLMLEKGKALVDERNKRQAWLVYCDYLEGWAKNNRDSLKFPKPKTFNAWYKENY